MSRQKKQNVDARGDPGNSGRFASEYHAPVLCNAVVTGLITRTSGLYVDGTLGGGGHAEALLASMAPDGRLYGFDRDPEAIQAVEARLSSEIRAERLFVAKGNFRNIAALMQGHGVESVDGLLLDLGVSSHQLDRPERGFSHRYSGPLDMRMDGSGAVRASEMLNTWSEDDIASILRRFGEEPNARRIARQVILGRPVESTAELAEIVRRCVPQKRAAKSLARVFQAVRIAINEELDALEEALSQTVKLLRPGGRIAVIAYHSLEDRRVKRFFRSGNFEGVVHRDLYGQSLSPLREVTTRPLVPSDEEMESNPRARSARLRIAERVTTAAMSD